MRLAAALAFLASFHGAHAFTAPSHLAADSTGMTFSMTSSRRSARKDTSQTASGLGSRFCAGVLTAVLAAALRPRKHEGRSVLRRADDNEEQREPSDNEIETGWINLETGEQNYVNPWEQSVIDPATQEKLGLKFNPYYGPVYKKVPIGEGVKFPLDPKLYSGPVEPPPPGVKWGDGRAPDGNWYIKGEDGENIQFWQGLGKRKWGAAVVRVFNGTGQFIINGMEAIDYLKNETRWWLKACEPAAALSMKNKLDIVCRVVSSGQSSQAGAIRQGLAKALLEYNFEWFPLLKNGQYLQKDYRICEEKKVGKQGARVSPPYRKR